MMEEVERECGSVGCSGLQEPAQTAPLEQVGKRQAVWGGCVKGEDEEAPPGTTLTAPAQGSSSKGEVDLTLLGVGFGVLVAGKVDGMQL